MGADPELELDFATAVFTGVGFSFQLGGRWQDRPNLFSVAIGPYGLFIGGPAASGGGLLKLRLYLNLCG